MKSLNPLNAAHHKEIPPTETPYANRSDYLASCSTALDVGRSRLEAGETIHISSDPGGYPGPVSIELKADEPYAFWSDWDRFNPRRFPAPVRAVATALRKCGMIGRFLVTHSHGTLEIVRS